MLYIYNPSSVFIFTQLQLHVNTQWLCEIVLCNACMVAKQRWHQNSMVFHSSYVLLVKKKLNYDKDLVSLILNHIIYDSTLFSPHYGTFRKPQILILLSQRHLWLQSSKANRPHLQKLRRLLWFSLISHQRWSEQNK